MRILRLWPTDIGVKAGVLIWGLLYLFLIGILPKSVLAQDPNNNYCLNAQGAERGGFALDKVNTCAGSAVTIKNGSVPTGLSNIGYVTEYSGKGIPTNFANGPSFTYTKPGSYTILQVGTINSARAVYCQVVNVVANDPIKFTVTPCANRRVTVVPDQNTLGQYDTYIVRWGDGVPQEVSRTQLAANPTHTYNSNYTNVTISVQGISGTVTNRTCESIENPQQVNLLASTSPATISQLITASDNSIRVLYNANAGATVELYQKVNGSYGAAIQKTTSGSFTVSTDAKQVQCFRVQASDACGTPPSSTPDEVCSMVVSATAGNKQNTVTWQPYAGTSPVRTYRILRNGSVVNTVTDRNQSSYVDNNKIECGTQYCYQLEATVTGTSQAVVTSAPVCVTGSNGDTPGEVGGVLVSVEDGHPRLQVTPPTALNSATASYTMIVSRSDGSSGTFQTVATLDRQSVYVDESANSSAGSYCYQVVYKNSCGLTSPPSTPVCTVFLSSGSASSIDWTAESPFGSGSVSKYIVEVIDSVNGTSKEIVVAANTHYEPDPNDPNLQYQKYRIRAESSAGVQSYSNFFAFRREARILVPDAFTPNGDGMNDVFLAKGVYVDKFTMNIYDRWGEVIYSTTDKTKGWDGMANGQHAMTGQYMYRIEMIDLTGVKTVRTGALLLVR